MEIEGSKGDILSLLPLGGDAAGVSTLGLLYPLDAETLNEGYARGMSTREIEEHCSMWSCAHAHGGCEAINRHDAPCETDES